MEPIDVGTHTPIKGDFDGSPDFFPIRPGRFHVRRFFLYSNGYRTQVDLEIDEKDIPEPYLVMKREIDQICKQRLMEVLFETLVPPNHTANPKMWRGVKTQVFISYRGTRDKEANELFHLLGNYGDQGLFLPRMDRIDMQAGNWLDQLMQMIGKCDVFIPLLTPDYLSGPIARPEADQALRNYYHNRSKRIVPLLIEGTFQDYQNHFLGGFHIVDARKGFTDKTFTEIASLCLGITRNPYE